MEQSSILSAKFDCPVARQNISFLATAHDCETGFFFFSLNGTNISILFLQWLTVVKNTLTTDCDLFFLFLRFFVAEEIKYT